MENQRTEKKKLSKSILEMKFMKRSKEKFILEQDEQEARALFASEVTEAMRVGGNKVVIEPSFVPCEGLLMGRLSYHGMNPEIEKLVHCENAVNKEEPDKDNSMEISDMEMARRYATLIGTISNKFRNKKQKRLADDNPMKKMKKRAKFMNPADV